MATKITLLLRPHEVCVWEARLDDLIFKESEIREILSADEILRARRYARERDRKRFSVGRAILRLILGRHLSVPAREIVFRHGPNGKPGLDGTEIRFNMSRSAGRAVYAVSLGRDVGVDVEQIRDLPGLTEVARRLFAASERELLAGSPESSRTRVFFRLWSRKEALAKAIGSGLFNQLNVIDLSALSSGSNILVKWPGDPGRDREWAVCDLGEDEGFAMALAAEWPCVLPPRLRPFAMDSGQ